MLKRNGQGQVIRVQSYTNAMFKRSGEHQMHKDAGLAALDAVRSLPVKYTGPGYKVRKCSR